MYSFKLYVVPDEAYKQYWDQNENKPWYTKYLKMYPRGFARRSEGAIYMMESHLYNDALLAHEFGHLMKYPGEDHGGFPGCLLHAVRVNFDVRAFTGLLRLRSKKPQRLYAQYLKWRMAVRPEWVSGIE